MQGGHHLLGNVSTVSDSAFKALVSRLVLIFSCQSTVPVVIVPPIPRYISGGCCVEASHSTNTGNDGYKEDMVDKVGHLRKILRGELSGSTLNNYWVQDVIADLSSAGLPNGNKTEVSNAIGDLYCSDNVHLTTVGFTRLVAGITDSIKLACNKQNTADIIITGEKQKYYWRGFVSTHGGKRSAHSATSYKLRTGHSRGGGGYRGGQHPYRGPGGHSGPRGRQN